MSLVESLLLEQDFRGQYLTIDDLWLIQLANTGFEMMLTPIEPRFHKSIEVGMFAIRGYWPQLRWMKHEHSTCTMPDKNVAFYNVGIASVPQIDELS